MPQSSDLVDPCLWPGIESVPQLTLDRANLPAIRSAIAERFAIAAQRDDPAVTVETLYVAGGDGEQLRVLAYRPKEAAGPLPAILHLHGGGYVMGTPEICHVQHLDLVRACGVAIYSLDYRLAPETPYPGPVEDAYAMLRWLHEQADMLGIDSRAIGVKGESAGGGLAAALTLVARDRGGPALAFQLLTYPMLDDRTASTAPDPHPFCGDYLWTPAFNRAGWEALLGHAPGGTDVPAYAAAARAADLSGLPPAFVAVGALDLFLEEDLAYVRRLSRAGVPVELHVYPGAVHGFGLAPGSWIDTNSERDLRDALMRFTGQRA